MNRSAAPVCAPASDPVALGLAGLGVDQALRPLFHQYSRSRREEWLRSGHIKVDGQTPPARMAVSGGEQVLLTPPQPPGGAAPRAQRMPLKIVHEDAALMVIDKPAGVGGAPRGREAHPPPLQVPDPEITTLQHRP